MAAAEEKREGEEEGDYLLNRVTLSLKVNHHFPLIRLLALAHSIGGTAYHDSKEKTVFIDAYGETAQVVGFTQGLTFIGIIESDAVKKITKKQRATKTEFFEISSYAYFHIIFTLPVPLLETTGSLGLPTKYPFKTRLYEWCLEFGIGGEIQKITLTKVRLLCYTSLARLNQVLKKVRSIPGWVSSSCLIETNASLPSSVLLFYCAAPGLLSRWQS